jgi:hypothetical protein
MIGSNELGLRYLTLTKAILDVNPNPDSNYV